MQAFAFIKISIALFKNSFVLTKKIEIYFSASTAFRSLIAGQTKSN